MTTLSQSKASKRYRDRHPDVVKAQYERHKKSESYKMKSKVAEEEKKSRMEVIQLLPYKTVEEYIAYLERLSI